MKNEVLYYLSSMKGNILDTVSSAIINNAKGQISKWVLQENKPRQIFQKKKKISYPLIRTRVCTNKWVRNVRFLENLAYLVFL